MRTDALEIARFYRSARGRAARDMMLRRLSALWPSVRGLDVLGLGYAPPVLEPMRGEARRTVAFMPAGQGAVPWPPRPEAASLTVLGDDRRLPFAEALFDRIVLVHALEEADDPRRLLRELWRVLAPEGRIMVIAASRSGLWSRAEATPFGHGRPFSRGQLDRLLTDALFEPVARSRALYAPPWGWACGPRTANGFETVGERVLPGVGGLILAEAVKHVGAIHPGAAQRVRRKALEAGVRPALSPRSTDPVSRQTQKGAP